MVSWEGGRVSTRDVVAVRAPWTGSELRARYIDAIHALTFGAVRMRREAVMLGPVTLLRFGSPVVTAESVEWPIEGGALAHGGGRWIVRAAGGEVTASVTGFAPRLPRVLYSLTHLQVHQLFTRLYLLRIRGREPAPGRRASADERLRAATVDLALCATLARLTGSRKLGRISAIAAVYHVVCWTLAGQTLGGLVMRQRVVAVDGSRLTAFQAVTRLAVAPISWLVRRPLHDELAGTEVVAE